MKWKILFVLFLSVNLVNKSQAEDRYRQHSDERSSEGALSRPVSDTRGTTRRDTNYDLEQWDEILNAKDGIALRAYKSLENDHSKFTQKGTKYNDFSQLLSQLVNFSKKGRFPPSIDTTHLDDYAKISLANTNNFFLLKALSGKIQEGNADYSDPISLLEKVPAGYITPADEAWSMELAKILMHFEKRVVEYIADNYKPLANGKMNVPQLLRLLEQAMNEVPTQIREDYARGVILKVDGQKIRTSLGGGNLYAYYDRNGRLLEYSKSPEKSYGPGGKKIKGVKLENLETQIHYTQNRAATEFIESDSDLMNMGLTHYGSLMKGSYEKLSQHMNTKGADFVNAAQLYFLPQEKPPEPHYNIRSEKTSPQQNRRRRPQVIHTNSSPSGY